MQILVMRYYFPLNQYLILIHVILHEQLKDPLLYQEILGHKVLIMEMFLIIKVMFLIFLFLLNRTC